MRCKCGVKLIAGFKRKGKCSSCLKVKPLVKPKADLLLGRIKLGATLRPEWLNGTMDFYLVGSEPDLPVTAAFVFVTSGNHLALTNVVKRGWDLPGGHVDDGEVALDAALRELEEETACVADNAEPVAYAHVRQSDEKYPEDAAMMFYSTEAEMQELSPSLECDAAEWVPFEKLDEYCSDKIWFPLVKELYF